MSLVLIRDQRQNVDPEQLRSQMMQQVTNLHESRVQSSKLRAANNQLQLQLADLRKQLEEAHAEIGAGFSFSLIRNR